MFHRSLVVAVTVAALVTAGPAAAADAPRAPLRTMVYDVAYSTATQRREQTSGFFSNPSGTMGSVAGSGAVDRRFTSDEPGSITIAVVAATADGGLVVDSTFVGRSVSHPPIRVAIFKRGGLSYDPRTPLGPAEVELLPYLARGFIADRTIAPGEAWTEPQRQPASGTTTYRISHVDNERATLDIDGSVSLSGPSGYDEHQLGTAVYATDVLAPVSLDLHAHIRRQASANEDDTTDAHLVATLVRDSFGKR